MPGCKWWPRRDRGAGSQRPLKRVMSGRRCCLDLHSTRGGQGSEIGLLKIWIGLALLCEIRRLATSKRLAFGASTPDWHVWRTLLIYILAAPCRIIAPRDHDCSCSVFQKLVGVVHLCTRLTGGHKATISATVVGISIAQAYGSRFSFDER